MENIGSLCAPRRNSTLSRSYEEIRVIALTFGIEQHTRALKLLDGKSIILHLKSVNPLRINLDRAKRGVELGDSVFNRIKSERRISIRTDKKNHFFLSKQSKLF